jgi:hypothetical protein
MRIATTLEILRRGVAGDDPDGIADAMHLGRGTVREVLDRHGYPNREAMAAGRETFRRSMGRDVWAVAELAEQFAHTIRLEPLWVHTHTAQMTHQELRELVAVQAAMLPDGINARDALEWIDTGKKPGRPRKDVAS